MTTVLIESDPEVRELVEHMTRVLGLPRFMQQFSVHFKVGEPIRVDVVYFAARQGVNENVH
jgi:hypothetical protein